MILVFKFGLPGLNTSRSIIRCCNYCKQETCCCPFVHQFIMWPTHIFTAGFWTRCVKEWFAKERNMCNPQYWCSLSNPTKCTLTNGVTYFKACNMCYCKLRFLFANLTKQALTNRVQLFVTAHVTKNGSRFFSKSCWMNSIAQNTPSANRDSGFPIHQLDFHNVGRDKSCSCGISGVRVALRFLCQ